MNEIIIYLLKVVAIQGTLYLLYRLLFRNSARHSLNRGFLLGALIAAFAIPFIQLPLPTHTEPDELQSEIIIWLSEPTHGLEEFELIPVKEEVADFSIWSLLPWLYGLIALVLLIRSLVYLTLLQRLKKHSEYINKRWFKLFKTSHERPFSFFSNVFIPKPLFGSDSFRQILAHECVHVRQFHSVDRLLLDFVVSLFWFNPFIYLYRNALIEIHEYQADEAVVRRFQDPIGYQEILFSQLQSAQYSGLVSHFNFSMIKKRIVMMNKQNKKSGWVYMLTVPVTLMVVFAFSSKEAMEPINEVGDEIATLLGPEKGFDWPELKLKELLSEPQKEPKGQFQKNEPSILPFKNAGNIRMTSGYGMRNHPVYKVRKMHMGMDFSCPLGTEIIATADGVIAEINVFEKGKGYGKLLVIDHGDGYVTRYAQLSEFKVKEGDKVKKGDVVALSGNSGASTAPHLHYEVKKDDKFVNPMHYIHDYNFKINSNTKGSIEVDPEEGDRIHEEERERLAEEHRALEVAHQAEKVELQQRERELMHAMEKREQDVMLERRTRELEERSEIAQLEAEKLQEMAEIERVEHLRMQARENDENTLRLVEELKYVNAERTRAYEEAIRSRDMIFIVDGEQIDKEEAYQLDVEQIDRITIERGKEMIETYGDKAENGVVYIETKGKRKIKTKNKDKEKDKDKKS